MLHKMSKLYEVKGHFGSLRSKCDLTDDATLPQVTCTGPILGQ